MAKIPKKLNMTFTLATKMPRGKMPPPSFRHGDKKKAESKKACRGRFKYE